MFGLDKKRTPEEQAQFDRSCQTMKENYQLALTL